MKENNKNYLSAKYFNDEQINSICNVLTDIYTEKKCEEGKIITQIDIEDFVEKILGAKVVYESIDVNFCFSSTTATASGVRFTCSLNS